MWVLIALASLLVIIIVVLSVPLDLVFRVEVYGRPRFRMRIRWLFGGVSREIRRGEKKPEEKKRVTEVRRKAGKRPKVKTMVKILRTRGLLRQFKRLLKGVFRQFRIRDLAADLRVGLHNPADTGLLFALLGPAVFFLNSALPCQIRVQPSFGDEAALEGYLHGEVRLQPIRLVGPLAEFAFSLPTMRVAKAMVLGKWKRKS